MRSAPACVVHAKIAGIIVFSLQSLDNVRIFPISNMYLSILLKLILPKTKLLSAFVSSTLMLLLTLLT